MQNNASGKGIVNNSIEKSYQKAEKKTAVLSTVENIYLLPLVIHGHLRWSQNKESKEGINIFFIYYYC